MTRDQHWLLTQRRRHRRDKNDLRPMHVFVALGCWGTVLFVVIAGWTVIAEFVK